MSLPIVAYYWAWNTTTNRGEASDSDNHTIKWSKDGVESVASNLPAATSTPGLYKVQLTADEVNCRDGLILGLSSTSAVVIVGMQYLFKTNADVLEMETTEVRVM